MWHELAKAHRCLIDQLRQHSENEAVSRNSDDWGGQYLAIKVQHCIGKHDQNGLMQACSPATAIHQQVRKLWETDPGNRSIAVSYF